LVGCEDETSFWVSLTELGKDLGHL